MKDSYGTVFWLTGLSGSGKTTIGLELIKVLRTGNLPVIFLDGDNLREIIGNVFGHTREERLKASLIYARLCHNIALQNIHVVCSTISLFKETQDWNRDNIPGYLEIFLDVPLSELHQRDPKNIYKRARNGQLSNIVGIDIEAEFPLKPDLVLNNYGECSIEQGVKKILQLYKKSSLTINKSLELL